ncbi:MAG: hypothetical protein RL701_4571, partial [Pseudomonadota bacterium]
MHRQQFLTWLAAGMMALPVVACGDDDDGNESGGAGEGGSPANAGKGGSSASGKGGSSAAGKGGSGGGGSGGGGSSETYAKIEQVTDTVLTQANDLRGLTYSSTGKIWASGHTNADAKNRKIVLARFNADGTPDTSFDEDGFLVHDFGPGDEQSMGLVELEGGDVVVQVNRSDNKGGAAIKDKNGGADGVRASGVDVMLARFTKDGELVKSFGTDGVAAVLFGWAPADDESWPVPTYDTSIMTENQRYSGSGFPSDQAWGVQVDKSGDDEKLVVTGFGPAKKVSSGDQRVDNDRYVAKLLANTGAPDPDFNDGSAYTFGLPDKLSDGGRRALVEDDGTIISSGYTNLGADKGNHVVLLRLKKDGKPDTDFGFGEPSVPGVAVFNPFVENGGVAECYGIARAASGRYVTTGYGRATGADKTSTYGYTTSDGPDLVSFAVKADGKSLDKDWGIDGTRAIQSEEAGLGGTEDRGRDLVVLKDGRAVQVGRYGTSPAIFVLTPDGEFDKAA